MSATAQSAVAEVEFREWNADEHITESQFEAQLTHDMQQFYADFSAHCRGAIPCDDM